MVAETPVLIAGGGPCGLAASLTLSKLGIDHVLVDRHVAPLHHPKAVGLMQRTAELLRGWDAEEEIRARGVPPEFTGQMVWCTTLAGEEIGRTLTPDPDAGREQPVSPAVGALRCPQHITEEVLRARAADHGTATLRYEQHVSGVRETGDGVDVTVLDRRSGGEEVIRAAYVIAADGNDSGLRAALGIGRSGQADMGHFINVFFRAPLGPWVADRPAWSYAVLTPEVIGAFVAIDGGSEWILHRNLAPGERLEDFPPERCEAVVRSAIGAAVDVDVLSVRSWIMGAELSTAFRGGRVILTGDAAHRTTPDGGVGMNTGIASAHNAAWKVGAAAMGWASDALLDTYEAERRPVAQRNVDYSAARGGGMGRMAEAVRSGDLDGVREAIAARGAAGTRQGMDLGYTYESDAIVPDGTDLPPIPDPVADYVQTARPGSRAPHVPLSGDRSTLDLFGGGLVVLTPQGAGDMWTSVAQDLNSGAPLAVHAIDADGFTEAYGLQDDGAVLVRPDGFVAWRTASADDDPRSALQHAVNRALCR